MTTFILSHVIDRDKKDLLYEREPIPKRKAKLEFLSGQIRSSVMGKLEYVREIKMMQGDFNRIVTEYDEKAITGNNILVKETQEVLEINQYFELHKMEILRKEEE